MINRLSAALCLLLLPCVAGSAVTPVSAGEHVVRTLRWSELQKAGKLKAGKVVVGDGKQSDEQAPAEELIVQREANAQPVIPLAEIVDPKLGWPGYQLRGKIRYENVEGTGFVEMWNYFPDGSHYFTRTLAESGPMGKLSGSSKWRDLVVPFFMQVPGQTKPAPGPNRLVLNVVLPGPGTVALGPLEMVQLAGPAQGGLGWWSPTAAMWVCALTLVLLGSTLGLLAHLARWGVPPAAILAIVTVEAILGVAVSALGLVGILYGQPKAGLLLVPGALSFLLFATAIIVVARQARERELRRMQALDVV